MASRFWVGGTGTWDATTTTSWSATTGGAGGASVPTSADDVFFDANSGGGTITLNGSNVTRNFVTTGFTGSFSGSTGTFQHNGPTLTLGSTNASTSFTGTINLTFNFAGVITVTCNGKSLPQVTVQTNATTELSQADALATVSAFTVANGKWTTNNFNATIGGTFNLSANANTRVISLGSSTITVNGAATAWNATTTATNVTFSTNTATVVLTANNAHFNGARNYSGMSLTVTGAGTPVIDNAGCTFANLTRTGTAAKADGFSLPTTTTVTGTVTLNGNSTVNRLLVQSPALGTTATITAAAVSASNVDLMDITGAGAASWNLSAITGGSGDAGGNSGITFTTGATQYKIAGGLWSSATAWSLTSGGAATGRTPLPQDDVRFDTATNALATAPSADMPRLGRSLDFTGYTGTINFSSLANTLYGSLTLAAGMTVSGAQSLTLAGRDTHTITSSGKTLLNTVGFNGPGGTYTLQDDLTVTGAQISLGDGTFDANGYNVTTPILLSTSGRTRTINMGSGTWTVTNNVGGTSAWSVTSAGLTLNPQTSTVYFSAARTGNSRNFAGSTNAVYNNLRYDAVGTTGALVLSDAGMTFNKITVGPGHRIIFPTGTGTYVKQWDINGTPQAYHRFNGVSGTTISTPDSAGLSVTGDIDIRCLVAPDRWTPAAAQMLVAKRTSATATTVSYSLAILTTGTLELGWSDGTTARFPSSSVATGVADGTTKWVRATRVSSTGVVTFYTSDDGSTWTQLGSTVTGVTGNIRDGAEALELGSNNNGGGAMMTGNLYYAEVRSGVGGTVVGSYDASAHVVGTTTYSDGTNTWTLSGQYWGDGSVNVTSLNAGTQIIIRPTVDATTPFASDYLRIQDILAQANAGGSGLGLWYAGSNSVNVSNNAGWIFTSPPAADLSYSQAVRRAATY